MELLKKNLNDVNERTKIVKEELARVKYYVNDHRLFEEDNSNFLIKLFNREKREHFLLIEDIHIDFFLKYLCLLGKYYGNSLRFLNDKDTKNELKEAVLKLKEIGFDDFYNEIPSDLEIIFEKEFEESEMEELFDLKSNVESEKNFIISMVGEQIDSISKALLLDEDIEGKRCCLDSFYLLIDETIKLMDFTSSRTIEEMKNDINEFSEKEHKNISEKKLLIKTKLKSNKVPSLNNGYSNFYSVINRLISVNKSKESRKDK